MIYSVKEIYFTMQGEGFHTGKHAVFCRFTGCNLWSGIEKDRANAICNFCDTDFVGIDGVNGSKYISADNLSDKIEEVWGKFNGEKFVVFTGGEPLLQLNSELKFVDQRILLTRKNKKKSISLLKIMIELKSCVSRLNNKKWLNFKLQKKNCL